MGRRMGSRLLSKFKVGQMVSFKSDVEQEGEVIAIKDHGWLVVSNPDGFPGDYEQYATETLVHEDRCTLPGAFDA